MIGFSVFRPGFSDELKLENMIGTDVAAGYVDYPTLAEMETAAV